MLAGALLSLLPQGKGRVIGPLAVIAWLLLYAAMETYLQSDIFKAVAANPNLAHITSRDFGVLEGPSRITRPRTVAAA